MYPVQLNYNQIPQRRFDITYNPANFLYAPRKSANELNAGDHQAFKTGAKVGFMSQSTWNVSILTVWVFSW